MSPKQLSKPELNNRYVSISICAQIMTETTLHGAYVFQSLYICFCRNYLHKVRRQPFSAVREIVIDFSSIRYMSEKLNISKDVTWLFLVRAVSKRLRAIVAKSTKAQIHRFSTWSGGLRLKLTLGQPDANTSNVDTHERMKIHKTESWQRDPGFATLQLLRHIQTAALSTLCLTKSRCVRE